MKLPHLLHFIPWLMLFAAAEVCGTAQEPDRLLFDGHEEALYTNPLQPWLEKHPQALPENTLVSSANWRGYVAAWEITGGELVLRRIDMNMPGPDRDTPYVVRNVIADVFPQLARGGTDWSLVAETGHDNPAEPHNLLGQVFSATQGVVADWYSGTLVIPQGELVSYVHMGYGSTYQFYQLFTIRNGRVLQRRNFSSADFIAYRDRQFAAFRKTAGFKAQLKSLMEGSGSDANEANLIDFLYEAATEEYLSQDYGTEPPPKNAAPQDSKP